MPVKLDPLLILVMVSTLSVVTLLIFSLHILFLNSTTTTQVTELDLKLANQLSHLRMIRHLRTMPLVRPTTLLLVVTDSESRHNLLRSQSMTTLTRTSSNCFASGTRLLRTLLTVRNITRSKSRLLVERMRHMATTLSIPSMFVQEST